MRVAGKLHKVAQFLFVFKELGKLAEERFHELLRRHRCAVWMPEARHHHVLNGSFLAVGKLNFDLSARLVFRLWIIDLSRWNRRFWFLLFGLLWLRLNRFPIPLRVAEVMVRLHKIVDREVVLAVIEPRAAPDDLFELDHRVDRAHQHDVADIAGIDSGRELLRGCQDGWNGLFVVLEGPQMLFAQHPVVGRNPLAVIRVGTGFHLVDEVPYHQSMGLVGTEDQRLLPLVDLRHEDFYPLLFPFLDLDDLVEVGFLVPLARLDLTFNHRIIWRINVLVQGRGNLLHPERREIPVVDPFLQRVDIDRIAEIGVGVRVVLTLGGGGQAELHGRGEIFHDAAPVAFVIGAAPVALVNDDEVEEVRRILAKIGRWAGHPWAARS